jgi:hypothetical protein
VKRADGEKISILLCFFRQSFLFFLVSLSLLSL